MRFSPASVGFRSVADSGDATAVKPWSFIGPPRGFTLVEMLVVILIMAVVATVAGDVLVSVLRSANKTNVTNEINQNANFVIGNIQSTARNAKSAFMSGSNLVIIDQYNQRHEYWVTTDLVGSYNVGVVKKSIAGGPFFTLTNNNPVSGVNVVSPDSQFGVSSANPPLINLTLRLTQGPSISLTRIDLRADSTFRESIGLRKY